MQSYFTESFAPVVTGEPTDSLVATKNPPVAAAAFAMNIDAMTNKVI
jgi:hypothetical protein